MCGIVGYIGSQAAAPILVDGLRSLEYRGYDSAGIALNPGDGRFRVTRASGKLNNLQARVDMADPTSLGIGHTRWATHGRPTEANAHPHRSPDGTVVAVHNGIFENFLELRAELTAAGHAFATETDTECLPILVSHLMASGLAFREAFRQAIGRMHGIYAVACLHAADPGRVLVARSGPPLVVGLGEGENFIASDVIPLLRHTRRVIYLEDGDLAEITREGVSLFRLDGTAVQRPVFTVPYDPVAAEKGGFKHFMQKEIFEQPLAVSNTLLDRLPLDGGEIPLDLPYTLDELRAIRRITILACGTSRHAGLVGQFYLEHLARIGVEVDYGSEYRYRDPVVPEGTLAIGITQSGETADTLAALKEAASRGARTLAICNVMGATAARQAEATLLTHAGPEIGVASTKAFTTQLVVLLLLALRLGEARGTLAPGQREEIIQALRELPALLERAGGMDRQLHAWAQKWHEATDFLYLGRGPLYPIALEGALKLKELSYIHAEGYPAGEMKHGPIALIDRHLPIVALMPRDAHREKVLSNLQEAAARDGRILALVEEGDTGLDHIAEDVLALPRVNPWLAPILYVVPLQLLSYHIAVIRGCDVDQPRNLAKSVTVE
ncbi:glutamine--fructose-6-phosphate transaminase (isomerizing) [Mesoterricola sediminis]|uniref:Glutamine--fructose-6-phosphate aminotransferase [isomerizing] n=1 Tax=Mesoterricola sediminis TaxID=2927980 RepID=A0AA48KGG9_9BACT|nr:glutamine--fructose-6-phosphate transaminase (isomerizing) [Mesoterricola sediminis]BDU77423.1 glutamine--fructose-6-phosphate aminotransferase [isomerizing] [Mesoterricola sediminis]